MYLMVRTNIFFFAVAYFMYVQHISTYNCKQIYIMFQYLYLKSSVFLFLELWFLPVGFGCLIATVDGVIKLLICTCELCVCDLLLCRCFLYLIDTYETHW